MLFNKQNSHFKCFEREFISLESLWVRVLLMYSFWNTNMHGKIVKRLHTMFACTPYSFHLEAWLLNQDIYLS